MPIIPGLFGISLGILIMVLSFRYIFPLWEPLYREVVTFQWIALAALPTVVFLTLLIIL